MFAKLFNSKQLLSARTGTTSPIFVPRTAEPLPVKPGEYFFIKVHSAQAAFRGSVFEHVTHLVITSRVHLNHPEFGSEEVFAIQRTRAVRRDWAEQLGLSPNLVGLVPATMTHISISIEFILDKVNNLATLSGLINDDSFLTTVSLAPGAAAIAKTIGGLAQKLLQTFIPFQERQPILQFTGDFNLGADAGGLIDGYYVIIGTRSELDPIPSSLSSLSVESGGLFINGQAVTNLSYIVFDVRRVPVRTRELNAGALWDRKLREAEGLAQEMTMALDVDMAMRKDTWNKCSTLLNEARGLLLADSNYAEREARLIYSTVYKQCVDMIGGKTDRTQAKASLFTVDTINERRRMGIMEEEDLDNMLAQYAELVTTSRSLLPDDISA